MLGEFDVVDEEEKAEGVVAVAGANDSSSMPRANPCGAREPTGAGDGEQEAERLEAERKEKQEAERAEAERREKGQREQEQRDKPKEQREQEQPETDKDKEQREQGAAGKGAAEEEAIAGDAADAAAEEKLAEAPAQAAGQQTPPGAKSDTRSPTTPKATAKEKETDTGDALGDSATTVHKFVLKHGGAVKALKRYIASFGGTDPNAAELGTQPPTRSYRSLRVLSEWDKFAASIRLVRSKEELSALHTANRPFKNAYKELITMAKAAENRCKHALEKEKLAQEKDKKMQTDMSTAQHQHNVKKARTSQSAAGVEAEIFNGSNSGRLQESVCSIDLVGVTNDKKLTKAIDDWRKPVIFRFSAEVTAQAMFKTEIESLQTSWLGSHDRGSSGRAQHSLGADAAALLAEMCMIEGAHFIPRASVKNAALLEHLEPTAFAVVSHKMIVSFEHSYLRTFRLIFEGTREVYCMPGFVLMSYLSALSADKLMPTVGQLKSIVSKWTVQDLEAFMQADKAKNAVFRATVGPNDCLCLPAGWYFLEKIGGHDILGMRLQMLAHCDLDTLDRLNTIFIGQGKPSHLVQAAIDCITLAEDA